MADEEPERPDEPEEESPATWENVVVGKAKEFFGHLTHNKEIEEEGEEQVDAAHEAREEYRDEHEG
jgi:uncharacterized protein YjbJ (UPF0337 family)